MALNYNYLKARLSIPDPYAALGIKQNATPQEAQKAYIKLARAVHPDKATDPSDEQEASRRNELAGLLNAAYDSLRSDRAGAHPASTSGGKAPRYSKPNTSDCDEDEHDVASEHPTRKHQDVRLDPLLFHMPRDREAEGLLLPDRVKRDATNLAILRQATLDEQRLDKLDKLQRQAKNDRLQEKRQERQVKEAKKEVKKLEKTVLKWERKSKPKRGVVKELTNKQRTALRGTRKDLQRAEATVRDAEGEVEMKELENAERVDESEDFVRGALDSNGDAEEAGAGGDLQGGAPTHLIQVSAPVYADTAQEGRPNASSELIAEDGIEGGTALARKTCQSVDLLEALQVNEESGYLNATTPIAEDCDDEEESNPLVEAQWQRRAADKSAKIEVKTAQQRQDKPRALAQNEEGLNNKIARLARETQQAPVPTGEVAVLLQEAAKRRRTGLTKGRSTDVSVSALSDSLRKADRWVYSFASDGAFADDEPYLDHDEHGNEKLPFDNAAEGALIDAAFYSAHATKHRIDVAIEAFTRSFNTTGVLDLPHQCTPECQTVCAEQRYATKHTATIDEGTKFAAAIPLPLPDMAELDFLAWRRADSADSTISNRMNALTQTPQDGENLVFSERAKVEYTGNAAPYLDACRPMSLGEALVYLDQEHGYSLDFILDLPRDLGHVLVSFMAARDVALDDKIDAVFAKWLVDRAQEGREQDVQELISSQGKRFFAAMTFADGSSRE